MGAPHRRDVCSGRSPDRHPRFVSLSSCGHPPCVRQRGFLFLQPPETVSFKVADRAQAVEATGAPACLRSEGESEEAYSLPGVRTAPAIAPKCVDAKRDHLHVFGVDAEAVFTKVVDGQALLNRADQ